MCTDFWTMYSHPKLKQSYQSLLKETWNMLQEWYLDTSRHLEETQFSSLFLSCDHIHQISHLLFWVFALCRDETRCLYYSIEEIFSSGRLSHFLYMHVGLSLTLYMSTNHFQTCWDELFYSYESMSVRVTWVGNGIFAHGNCLGVYTEGSKVQTWLLNLAINQGGIWKEFLHAPLPPLPSSANLKQVVVYGLSTTNAW